MSFTRKNESGFCAVASLLQPCPSPVCTASEILKVDQHLGPIDTCCVSMSCKLVCSQKEGDPKLDRINFLI